MNIAAIQTFLAVHRLGNLNRAAEELNVTQSAVTARLDALEQSLDAQLLNRSRKGATLTKAGYAFLEQADIISRSWEKARNRTAFPDGVTQLFSFVCDPGLWDATGRDLVEGWRMSQPEIAFEIWCAGPRNATDWLISGMSDAALTTDPLTGPEIRSRALRQEILVQVATTPRKAMAWDPAYIFVDYGQAFRHWHGKTWPGDETARLGFSNPAWALNHLLSNGGSAYLPESLVAPHVTSGSLFPVSGSPEFERTLFLNWRAPAELEFPRLFETGQ
jgi:DNA-binding transcriptional LysR family regulator